ncbi:MAG: RnfABCDGE type electron transport complex subunit B [Deltaproteobacteria bacterium]|nr:RnfABCDGE type electron transport complex subunit B [Deltaproteobacteria bacterium]
MLILIAIVVLGLMGLVFAGLLGFAAGYFHVEEDPRIGQVLAVLPGANCGACGLAGCRDYSEKLVLGEARPNACTAGGTKVAEALAAIMGVEALAMDDRKVAAVHCGATVEQRKPKGHYRGVETCLAVSLVDGGGLACSYGCLGRGDCHVSCPFAAIRMEAGLPVIDAAKCTACGNCIAACPRKIISLRPASVPLVVACSSRDTGAAVRKICAVGCIGCKLCVKQAPEAFSVVDNLAAIDYTKSVGPCDAVSEKCPTKCIVLL